MRGTRLILNYAPACIFGTFLVAGYVKRGLATPIDLTLLTASATWMLVLARVLSPNFKLPVNAIPVGVLYGLFALSTVLTTFSGYGLEKVSRLFLLTLLASLAPAVLFNTAAELRRLLGFLAIVGLALIAIGFATAENGARMTALGSNEIAMGRVAGMSLIWMVVLLLERRIGFWAVAVIASAAGGMLASGARGPIFAGVFALGVLFLTVVFRSRLSTYRFLVATGLVSLLVIPTLKVLPDESLNRVDLLISGEWRNTWTTEHLRLQMWSQTSDAIRNHPLGVGWGGFVETVNFFRRAPKQYPHNIVLEIFLEAGWLTGMYFVLLLLYALSRMWPRSDASTEAKAVYCIFVYWLFNSFVSGDVNDNKLFFAFLTLACTLPVVGHVPQTAEGIAVAREPSEAGESTPRLNGVLQDQRSV